MREYEMWSVRVKNENGFLIIEGWKVVGRHYFIG
jgi:hypothetical protein